MGLHDDALTVLSALPTSVLRDRYVEHLRTHPDGMYRTCSPDHITASMLVLSHDHRQVLLTLHSKARQWFQFGGHCEPADVTLVGAAMREALEESGLPHIDVDPVPIHLDEHPVPFCNGGSSHLDVRFLGIAPEGAEHAVSQESLDVRWWPVDALPTSEGSIRELVRAALLRLVIADVDVVATDAEV
ncbi:MAG TPA: NUDIX domain-containing protein [Nocardioidaceae bacterium]|nr:NUDIX domain-containing protein [Nocardioidaceae bacterium]